MLSVYTHIFPRISLLCLSFLLHILFLGFSSIYFLCDFCSSFLIGFLDNLGFWGTSWIYKIFDNFYVKFFFVLYETI